MRRRSRLAARLFTNLPRQIARQVKHLKPVIEERERAMREYGKAWGNRPNDMLQWMMEEAKGQEKTVRNLSQVRSPLYPS